VGRLLFRGRERERETGKNDEEGVKARDQVPAHGYTAEFNK